MSEYSEYMAQWRELKRMEQRFFDNHWANPLLDAPHALISLIETKIARAALAEREHIIKLLEAERWELPNGISAGGQVYVPIEQAIALIRGEVE